MESVCNDIKAAITYYFTVLFEVFDKEKIICNKSLLPEKNGANKSGSYEKFP